jgi:hypothetical protein
MNKTLTTMTFSALVAVAANTNAQFFIAPLTSFGGDGWLAPGEGGYAYLGTGNNERGMAYGNGELYLVSRAGGNNVRRLNSLTGADLGGLDVTGISGGTFAVNAAAVGGDGAIYVGNLTTSSSTSPYKVYRWANNAAAPTVAYSGDPLGGVARFGDNLAAIGSGANTRLAAGAGNTAVVNDTGFALVDPTAGTASYSPVTGAAQGDFRLGLDFVDANTLLGTQGSAVGNGLRYADLNGNLLGTSTLSTASQRALGFSLIGGIGLLAAVDTVDGRVRIYDASTPGSVGAPVLFGSALPFTHTANANASGAVAWGDAYYDSNDGKWKSELYVLETNNGIQAYTISVPEPTSAALLGLGVSALIAFRRNRK